MKDKNQPLIENFLENVQELSSISEKLSFMKENLTKEHISDMVFLLQTPEFRKYIQFLVHKGRKDIKDFTEEEYFSISELVFILQSLYNYGDKEMPVSDEDYDVLYSILENKDIEIITTPILRSEVVHHKYTHLRGTLEKIYALDDEEHLSNESRKRLSDWITRTNKEIEMETGRKIDIGNEEVYIFPKWDGVSIIFEIDENNKIIRALTRGNTEVNEAEDVTFIFKPIEHKIVCDDMKGVAYGLKTEVMMKEEELEKYNKDHNTNYKSTRSIVSSIINSDEIDGREQLLEIVKLRTSIFEDGKEKIEKLSQEVFDRPFIRCRLKDVDAIRHFSNNHKYVDGLRCDGSVIYIIDEEIQKILGRKKEKNRFEVAYKFNEEVAYTKLKDIIFQMGTFGTINPVAIIEPVHMKGNEIKRVSLGSMQRFNSLQLSKGDKVKIIYEIIPYLIFDLEDPKCKKSKHKPIEPPKVCPECGEKLVYEKEIPSCKNPNCDYLKKKGIVNYIQKMNMSGISYETISSLYDYNIVKSIKDLYRLKKKKKEMKEIPGFGDGKVKLFLEEIDSHRNVIDSVLLGSIGIPHTSKEIFKRVLNYFTIDELMDLVDADKWLPLTEIKGIKTARAMDIVSGLQKRRSLILFLMDELEVVSGRDTNAYQVRFKACFTKIRSEKIKELIESKHGSVVERITKDTDFLIVPSKNTESNSVEKARKYGIDIVPIVDVEKYIIRNYR